MRHVYPKSVQDELNFAMKAGANFAANPKNRTYTEGGIKPGCFFAIRWGTGEDCVLVFTIDDNCEPTIYAQTVKTE